LATSANISGQPDCRNLDQLMEVFAGRVRLIVYKPEALEAPATTVVDLTLPRPEIIRQGEWQLPAWAAS
jgi:tRNA A37 threonylcarbamoyladenosine synthetase subunit TsaC/SUA5/YrdC